MKALNPLVVGRIQIRVVLVTAASHHLHNGHRAIGEDDQEVHHHPDDHIALHLIRHAEEEATEPAVRRGHIRIGHVHDPELLVPRHDQQHGEQDNRGAIYVPVVIASTEVDIKGK